MGQRRLFSAVAGIAAAALLAGCGAADPPPDVDIDTSQLPAPEAITWANQACDAIGAGGKQLGEVPELKPTSPEATKKALLGFLDRIGSSLEELSTELTALGPPPVPNGEKTLTEAKTTIAESKAAVKQAHSRLDKASVSSPKDLQSAVKDLENSFKSLSNPSGATEVLRGNHELDKAFTASGACQKHGI